MLCVGAMVGFVDIDWQPTCVGSLEKKLVSARLTDTCQVVIPVHFPTHNMGVIKQLSRHYGFKD